MASKQPNFNYSKVAQKRNIYIGKDLILVYWRVTMKKLVFPILCVLAIMLLADSASALIVPSARDLIRLQLLYKNPNAEPIYFRAGLISNIYGDLPAKYSPQDGQIYFPHYNLGPYGQLAYGPNDYIIYGNAYGNPGTYTSASYAGYYPEQNYGTYNYNWPQYNQAYSSYGNMYNGYPYALGYAGFGGYSGYNGYSGGYGIYSGANFGGSQYGSNIYTGYGDNIYPGPFGVGGDYPLQQQMPAGWTNPSA